MRFFFFFAKHGLVIKRGLDQNWSYENMSPRFGCLEKKARAYGFLREKSYFWLLSLQFIWRSTCSSEKEEEREREEEEES